MENLKFEKPRGVSKITVRDGLVQVHITGWTQEIPSKRIDVLARLAKHNISIDFLKITPTGVSFVASESKAAEIEQILAPVHANITVKRGCSVVLAHAVNIRDEEGLIANILKLTIQEGYSIEHISDMHDCALLVLDSESAHSLAHKLKATHFEVSHAN